MDIAGVIVGAIIGIVIGIVILLILGLILQWLWNTTLPDVLGVKEISTVQAIKLIFIAAILFGGHRVITVEAPPEHTAQQTETAS
ncbi:hypothetical protein GR183_04220 [Stappia sp. GBMRC 2046]|uniref:Uncharacterized protein n=1 Tax=Stappia sediminis TaxID=2692190 RepID=A0A7X3LS70_9HYPH|nr:hypothetical protein [Stappia sediminis]MXN64098.1 hypothetical protein [Stappia sediminis]